MLWAYFDESGWHAPRDAGGRLKKLTVGGCIASFESWECLSLHWSSALTAMKLPYFHMADFEARQAPYDHWTEGERKNRLNTLLTIIGGPDRHCYSFTNIARPDDTTSSIYERCAHDVLLELSMFGEEFAVVFAHHPEFGRHTELLDLMLKYGIGGTIRSCVLILSSNKLAIIFRNKRRRGQRLSHWRRRAGERGLGGDGVGRSYRDED